MKKISAALLLVLASASTIFAISSTERRLDAIGFRSPDRNYAWDLPIPGGGYLVTDDSASILTQKTIAGDVNTFSLIPPTALASAVPLTLGGTGQTTKAASFDALSPMTASGDVIYGGTSGTGTRLAKGSDGQVLKLVSGLPAWSTLTAGTGDVVGPASSVDSEISLFSSTTGKLLKSATGTGFVKVSSGVYQTPSATIAASTDISGQVPLANGGTGANGKTAGFDALSPMTASGDIIYGGASGTGTKLVKGSDTQVLTLASGLPTWASNGNGDVTGVASSVDSEIALFSSTTGKVIKRATGTGFVKVTSGVMGTPAATVGLSEGGTGQTTKAPAFDALQPMTAIGQMIYGGASGTGTALAVGLTSQYLKSNAGAAPTWSFPAVTASKTTTYPIVAADETIMVSGASGAFTTTLPTAVGVTGKTYTIKRTDMTLANSITLATTSSQTIDGVTTKRLSTQYEQYTVRSDGANWQVLEHYIPKTRTTFTPTGPMVTNTVYTGSWVRDGTYAVIEAKIAWTSTLPTALIAINLPTGMTLDTASLLDGANGRPNILGTCVVDDPIAPVRYNAFYEWDSTNAYGCFSDGYLTGWTESNPTAFAIASIVKINFRVPISNWSP